ncbi:MAG: M48 family metalloprotease [Thermoleophilaceae bacterium]|nr:M48 family metalloprotease [Thermoleophilaceae bacterium]
MANARRLYRLQLGLGALGLLATALALVVALTRVRLNRPSLEAIGEACRQMGLTDISPGSLLVLLLGSVSLAVVALAFRSAFGQLRARRRFLRGLRVIGRADAGGYETLIVDDPRPQAFCTGLLRPHIYVSRGTLDLLDDDELAAVAAHEAHHAQRRDPLRMFISRTLSDALFFMPVLGRLADRYAALAEFAADEAAVRRGGSRRPLAAALLAFEETPNAVVVGIAPERVDHLLGRTALWQLPGALLAGAAVTVAGLLALVLHTADATGHASVELPVLLAQACMGGMAVLPALLGAVALLASRRALARRDR